MAKTKEKARLDKKVASFNLVGEVKINDYTYKIDEKSSNSDWIWNQLNLGVDCGENGTVYAEMMGGYGSERDNVIYVHGKKIDNNGRIVDDFENQYTIDWDDRFDESITEEIGDMCFITVGLEKDSHDKTFTKRFLSAYDAINYIKQYLDNGMVVNIKGNLKYQKYQDNVIVKKEINSIYLSKAEKENYRATFIQTMLLTKDSVGKVDKERSVIPLYAKVIDYVKMWNDKEVKCNVPFDKTFEVAVDLTNHKGVDLWINKILKVKKGVTEITFEGDLIESGSIINVTEDDIPDDIKDLIEMGAYTLEEALTKCTENTSKERRMVVKKPVIRMVGEDGSKVPVVQKFENKYTEEDLILDFMYDDENETAEELQDLSSENTDEDWLSQLMGE